MFATNEQLVGRLLAEGVLHSSQIKEAFLRVDRVDFVTDEFADSAYVDHALPIGNGQTISQPYTVAFMLELLGPKRGQRVLDVGAGSGWTTALLAALVGEDGAVYGVEIVPELVSWGKENLSKYNFPQASIRRAGSQLGLPGKAPFDRILVSAEAGEIPSGLIEQLAVGGTMVVPVGDSIYKVTKLASGEVETEVHPGFVFVPLVGG